MAMLSEVSDDARDIDLEREADASLRGVAGDVDVGFKGVSNAVDKVSCKGGLLEVDWTVEAGRVSVCTVCEGSYSSEEIDSARCPLAPPDIW